MTTFSLAFMGLPAGSELWIIGGVVLLLFGGAKIPQLMRGLGRGVGELKVGLEEGKKAFSEAGSEEKKEDDKKGE
ncbi:MAG: twin-arginine translocase TatA/TatE family subunit [Fimbriimonas sp.]|nr:twin-arginine translocase TatA/TatE family subunit [Fimbriimonas sp.]